MTKMETDFCSLVEQYTLRKFGYHVSSLKSHDGATYDLKLKRLGDLTEILFPVFPEQVRDSVLTGQLPQGLLRSFDDCFKSQTVRTA